MRSLSYVVLAFVWVLSSAALAKTKAPRVFFVDLKDGAEIAQKTKIKFGVEGIKIRPASEAPDEKTSGHHHLLVNQDAMAPGTPIPVDAQHLHFGKGQTETELNLPPGKYKLTLQFADGAHRSYGQDLSATIHVTVK